MKSYSCPGLCVLVFLFTALAEPVSSAAAEDSLEKLGRNFWEWRAQYGPFSGDDVNRIERPGGLRDWSAAAVSKRRADLQQFEADWKAINPAEWSVPRKVDYRLLGAALARVHWELEVNPRWKRDPTFYLEQTLTPVAEALTVPPPYNAARSREILARLENVPQLLRQARENLLQPPAPFANAAIQALEDSRERLRRTAKALLPFTTLKEQALNTAAAAAGKAFEAYRSWLQERLPSLPKDMAIGRDAYIFFLKNVALYPYSPEQILAMGKQEWERAVAFETFEAQRNKSVPPLVLAKDIPTWSEGTAKKERNIREFLEKHAILTVPAWIQHYTLQAMPEYLSMLSSEDFAEADDFTSASRLMENCIRYVNPPSRNLGFFWRAAAQDPRPQTVHEGIPGHYLQLCLSWRNEDPIRRHYYDSGANEGIAFYAEEMMLQAGLFDDSPHVREIIYTFARLRALRVEVDVKLALGQFTLEQAAKYLEEKVPMDSNTARSEATFFSTTPGQAIAYQIGKLQIIKLLAEARMHQGDQFNLRAFHDFLWKNGNVPIALQRWEYLGRSDDVPTLTNQ
jgi:uncharacterized protein (DUF885 family)